MERQCLCWWVQPVHPYGSTSCWAGLWEENVAERGAQEPGFPGQRVGERAQGACSSFYFSLMEMRATFLTR